MPRRPVRCWPGRGAGAVVGGTPRNPPPRQATAAATSSPPPVRPPALRGNSLLYGCLLLGHVVADDRQRGVDNPVAEPGGVVHSRQRRLRHRNLKELAQRLPAVGGLPNKQALGWNCPLDLFVVVLESPGKLGLVGTADA